MFNLNAITYAWGLYGVSQRLNTAVYSGVHAPMMHIAYSPCFCTFYKFPIFVPFRFIGFPYFDHDAFTCSHQA